MKTNLKENIWIEGFERKSLMYDKILQLGCEQIIIYKGKTSEIPEELAKELVDTIPHVLFGVKIVDIYGNAVLFKNYKINKFTKRSGKRSIQSACPFNYCII